MTLDLPLTPDQMLLRDSIQRLVAKSPYPGWRDLSDTLWLGGVTVNEASGGFGGGMTDIAVVAAELGPALAGADWISHAMASWLLGMVAPSHPALPGLARGQRRAAIICPASAAAMPIIRDGTVCGTAELVAGAAEADLFLLAEDGVILAVDADSKAVEQRHRIMLDGSVTADLSFTTKGADFELLGQDEESALLVERANDMVLSARCAEAVGLMRRMMADSITYLGQRRQFGRQIASFQALRHRAADMQLALMKAGALTEAAIREFESDKDTNRGALVSAACIEVSDAARIVGEGAVQFHGAMGLTEELDLGRFFKRVLAIAAALGPKAGHLARYAEFAR